MSMDLETAQAVIAADRAARQERENAERRKLVGRFFKFHNSYGSGERWWMYASPRAVGEYGHVTGLTFQTTPMEVRVEMDGSCSTLVPESTFATGWIEIDAAEFWREAQALLALLQENLGAGPSVTLPQERTS